jgi:hypothetical protein
MSEKFLHVHYATGCTPQRLNSRDKCFTQFIKYRHPDNSRPVSFTVSAWDWVYATNLYRLRRERETSKRHVGEAHCVLTTAILLPQCELLLRQNSHGTRSPILGFADLRLTTPAKISRTTYTLYGQRANSTHIPRRHMVIILSANIHSTPSPMDIEDLSLMVNWSEDGVWPPFRQTSSRSGIEGQLQSYR